MHMIDEKVLWALWYDGVFGKIGGDQDEYFDAKTAFNKALAILDQEHDLQRWPVELIDLYHAKRQTIFPQYSAPIALDNVRPRMIK